MRWSVDLERWGAGALLELTVAEQNRGVLFVATRMVELTTAAIRSVGPSSVLALMPESVGAPAAFAATRAAAMSPPVLAPSPASRSGQGVAVVEVLGAVAARARDEMCAYVDGWDAIAARITGALLDPNVGAVVLALDSPGGDVAGLQESIKAIKSARDKAKKPVYAWAGEVAASAAYWLAASVADGGLFLPGSGFVGSIGAMSLHVDTSRALANEGIQPTIIRDPPGKAEALPIEPLSEAARASIQDRVSAIAGEFYAAIAEARGLKSSTVKAMNAAMFRGKEAVAAGLADGVASFEDVIAKAKQEIETMSLHDTAARVAGVPATATALEVETSLALLQPVVDAGRSALLVTGEADHVKATAKIAAWRDAADKWAKHAETQAAAAAAAERASKLAAVQELVKSGAITPARAWADPTAAPSFENIAPLLASWSLEHLRAMSTLAEPLAFTRAPAAPPASSSNAVAVAALTPEDLKICELTGQDPKSFAEHKAKLAARDAARAAVART